METILEIYKEGWTKLKKGYGFLIYDKVKKYCLSFSKRIRNDKIAFLKYIFLKNAHSMNKYECKKCKFLFF
jgi:hypothetical protein